MELNELGQEINSHPIAENIILNSSKSPFIDVLKLDFSRDNPNSINYFIQDNKLYSTFTMLFEKIEGYELFSPQSGIIQLFYAPPVVPTSLMGNLESSGYIHFPIELLIRKDGLRELFVTHEAFRNEKKYLHPANSLIEFCQKNLESTVGFHFEPKKSVVI